MRPSLRRWRPTSASRAPTRFLGTTPASPSSIADNGTALALVGNLFELNPDSGGTGPLLELNGSVVTTSTLASGWTPVGAVQTGNGFEVAFENAQSQFVVWNVDSNGNYISNATGILSGTSPELAGVEAAFGETTGPLLRIGGESEPHWSER